MATALITGGTSGIGAAFARQLAARGFDIVLVARNEARLATVAAELHARSGITVETLSADLAVRADVARVAERLLDESRPIDFLVNNAGFGVHTKLLDADTSSHEYAMDVMCRAVLILGAAAGRSMRSRGHGNILNVGSVAGLITMGSYSAIKAWVNSYSEGLAVELRGTGVTATSLMPGWVETEFHSRAGIRTSSIPEAMWIDADRLVAAALRDVDRRKVISIPTVRYRLLSWFARHAPRASIHWVSSKISSSRSDAPHQGEGSEHNDMKAENQ
ncbi:SDR family NAD(P)-dependent oxidoreductase [Salinibacterium sp. G-O1]|uniref:SDR family NAD(P)-dependent oxidoreductase n=1 Tax=Salinibacterium sp. G-O1 TaxID=3046208 RepID=UPI0024BAB17D|nr:SDR family NAD(P)-dependent oxidoreductase [Salinibacterium sp. G-O1]MDJ0335471.1 SDR family NAD(P)-dependent oxidoreductase [Salinibacterium sp. G-O1]